MKPPPRMSAGMASRRAGITRANSKPPNSTASCRGWKKPPSACRCSARPASSPSSPAPSPTRRMASISQARRMAPRTTGCIAAPRSASARAAVPANIWRNGWCMARPRSTCANSIRAASATGRRRTTRPKSPSPTITTCIIATSRASSTTWAGACASPRSMTS